MFFLLFSLSLSFIVSPAHADEICGSIPRLKGRVEILRLKPGEKGTRHAILAKKRTKINCTDIIITREKSRAKLNLGRIKMTMASNSRVEILNFIKKYKEPNSLSLTYGKIRTLFKSKKELKKSKDPKNKIDDQTHLIIKTRAAVAGVRGTDFYLSYDPNSKKTQQATLSGLVEVEQSTTGERVMVKKGQQVDVIEIVEKGKSKDIVPKALVVKEIEPLLVKEIKQTSSLAKKDASFTHPDAIQILGEPKTWIAPNEDLPGHLKNIDNEF